MSWSTSVPATKAEEFEAAIDAAQLPEYAGMVHGPEMHEQLAAAKEVAKAVFRSGAVGREGVFTASMSGHANENHGPGSAVNVNVYQTYPPAPAPEPVAAAATESAD